MRYKLVDHALEQARDRGISELTIDETLNSPGQIIDAKRGRRVYQSKVMQGNREALVRLIVEERRSEIVVVTVYLTTDVDRYWGKEDEGEV
jgi:hypothetical protein